MAALPVAVDRRSGLSAREFLREYERPLRPLVLTDATRDWPAHGKWSTAWLRENFGDRLVKSRDAERPLGEVLDAVDASTPESPGPYLIECYLNERLPELLADITSWPGNGAHRLHAGGLPRKGELRDGLPELLVAGRGTRFPVLHFDFHHLHAFITQLTGDKRFRLYPPTSSPLMYPQAERPNLSSIDGFDPVDLQRFPRYAEARATEVLLHPGETLFVPSGWWHRTQILSTSVALTFNSVGPGNWKNFSRDHMAADWKQRPLRSAMKQSYMGALGVALTVKEKLAGL